MFDTGTKGHGVRQIFKRVKAIAEGKLHFGPSSVTVVGLVDGEDEAQQDKVISMRKGDNSPFVLDLSYRRVPRVLTEDCEVLCGCEVDLTRNCLVPVVDPGQIRVFAEGGRLIKRITSSSIGAQYRSMMISPLTPIESVQVTHRIAPESEKDAVRKVLEHSMREESIRLEQAWCMGLVSDRCRSQEKSAMPQRYEQALERYSHEVWDFAQKRFVST